ncbi:peptidylprolyl isomerase [Pacificimonas flava]|uniref:Peptidyl-prolyl cis-trans isomerase n=1 Tax=Pacificimonas flava TaxID=1234595 RepID=M2T682_9SPHN|nr:peptidylprolyl isomerase [Pacificimonas flava]EMD82009.1 peptidyl-prolyl cis-trans isomerase [Pacificimonas flava]MBB5280428.1 peptidylprolyl isomerase [Pacificimonas flava]
MPIISPALLLLAAAQAPAADTGIPPGTAAVLDDPDTRWIQPDPEWTLYMDMAGMDEIEGGRVVIRLSKGIGRQNSENIKRLVRAGHFANGSIDRVQENYVVQWSGAANAPRGAAEGAVPGEFEAPRGEAGMLSPIPFSDAYAPQVGFLNGFPAAQDGNRTWLAHCYGALGVGRGDDPDGADGSELYVVIGQAPRHLDRNITLAGQVLSGMEYLTSLPRGTEALGFYREGAAKPRIANIRVAADVPATEREDIELMEMSGHTLAAWADARANRARDGWFNYSHGAIDLCNLPVPVRRSPREE